MNKRLRILVAEDEVHIARLILYKFEKEGFSVSVVQNGRQAIELFSSGSWDAVLLDVMMPQCDGWEALQGIRGRDAGIPILMLTAKSDSKTLENAAMLGATDFIAKPFDPDFLVVKLREVIENQGLKSESESESGSASPNFQDLKQEFVASLGARRVGLQAVIVQLKLGAHQDFGALQEIAHKLAGVAESYGFPALTLIAGALDDFLAGAAPPIFCNQLIRYAELLDRALIESQKTGMDPVEAAADPITLELISASEFHNA